MFGRLCRGILTHTLTGDVEGELCEETGVDIVGALDIISEVCGDDAAKDFSEKELVDRWATAIQTKRAPGLQCPEPLHSPGGGDLATSLPRLAAKASLCGVVESLHLEGSRSPVTPRRRQVANVKAGVLK